MNRAMMFLAAAAFALAACEEKKPETTETPESKNAETTAATTATAAAQPVTIDDSDLATPADFEAEAEKAITKANYKTELATLETDISKE